MCLTLMTWIGFHRSAPLFPLLSILKPGTRFRRDISTGVLSYFLHTPRGYVLVPLRFIVDGIVVSPDVFQMLTADMINYYQHPSSHHFSLHASQWPSLLAN